MDWHALFFWLVAVLTGICAIGVVVTQNIVRSATWLLFALAGTSGIFFLLGADFVGATQLLVYVGGTLVLVVFGVMLTAQGPFVNLKTSPVEWAIGLVVGGLLFSVLALCLLMWPVPPAQDVQAQLSSFNDTEKRPSNPKKVVSDLIDRYGTEIVRREAIRLTLSSLGSTASTADIQKDIKEKYSLDIPEQAIAEHRDDLSPGGSTNSVVLGGAMLGLEKATPRSKMTGFPEGTPPPTRKQVAYLLPFEIVSVHLLVVLIGAAYLARAKRRRGATPS